MASAALIFSLFSFSAILFLFVLLHAPAPGLAANLLATALDRFLDGRGLMELATRRNMILLCHAILFLILRDAGVLTGGRRSHSAPGEAATATAAPVVTQTDVPVPPRPHATRSAVVMWRRRQPRNRAVVVAPVHEHDDVGRIVVECCWPAAEAAATWAAPVLTTCPPPAQAEAAATWAAPVLTTRPPPAQAAEEAAVAAVATTQMVLAESSPTNDAGILLDRHDRAAVVEPLEHPSVIATDGERDDCDDRRIITIAHDDDEKRMDDQTAGMEMELADDRAFEEFIESQRRKMRQESLQLLRLSYQYQAIAATCY